MDFFLNWNKYILFVKEDMLTMEMLNISSNSKHPKTKNINFFLFFT